VNPIVFFDGVAVSITASTQASASVTNWPVRLALLVALGLLAGALLFGMRRGWVRRARADESLPAPLESPPSDRRSEPTSGRYLAATRHENWLSRFVAFDLGVPSRTDIFVDPDGVWFRRVGARSLFVPSTQLRDAALSNGIAGKGYEAGGLVLVTWQLGDELIDVGFRAEAPDCHLLLVDEIRAVLVNAQTTPHHIPGGAS